MGLISKNTSAESENVKSTKKLKGDKSLLRSYDIILVVLAVGASNQNVKNFARSYFCLAIIIGIIILIVILLGGGAALFSTIGK